MSDYDTEMKSVSRDSAGAVLKPVRGRRDRPAFPPVSGLYYYRSLDDWGRAIASYSLLPAMSPELRLPVALLLDNV
jgi:hypothetical protein